MKIRGYDIVGNIAIVKFSRESKLKDKKKYAEKFMKIRKSVKSVYEKSKKFSGRLRTLKTKWIAGEKNKKAIYKENNCEFKFNVDTCYFSPRLASERKKIASKVKKKESVLVMFGGVAPFAIVIAKIKKPKKIISIELGKECSKYAKENVKRNKVNVKIIQGNVRKKIPNLKEKFDRIIMPRPNLKDNFLDITFPKIKKKGIIHYYGFYKEDEKDKMKQSILNEAKKAKKKIKIQKIEKAGEIGVRTFRYRADIKIE